MFKHQKEHRDTSSLLCARFHSPFGFPELLNYLTREVLRAQPENIYEFCLTTCQQLINERDNAILPSELVKLDLHSGYIDDHDPCNSNVKTTRSKREQFQKIAKHGCHDQEQDLITHKFIQQLIHDSLPEPGDICLNEYNEQKTNFFGTCDDDQEDCYDNLIISDHDKINEFPTATVMVNVNNGD
ncbi:unnamed protein product [Didymodactylos carnosus]|uniref:RIIa domain-containing protein n=1 Tax=Didymodactylos carnosus TaxID=1234261 RepID=A0A814DAW8_9BILA|nr:unnamed protein product [Didymodactylos carnosus]CAF1018266.1 unnamed protein product [Didymodactylos carnosus]CAF3727474.1 unnamed protein product [Didymodactylos carnosus]CAF3787539.1 unnamed protein product [Didymodactylos carnosus]